MDAPAGHALRSARAVCNSCPRIFRAFDPSLPRPSPRAGATTSDNSSRAEASCRYELPYGQLTLLTPRSLQRGDILDLATRIRLGRTDRAVGRLRQHQNATSEK